MVQSRWLMVGLFISTTFVGCGGGGTPQAPPPDPDPPTIQTVTPSGAQGLPGAEIVFSATATNEPTSWSWSFSEGVLPRESNDPSPTVLLAKAGTVTATVIASNAGGTSPQATTSIEIGAPVAPGATADWTPWDVPNNQDQPSGWGDVCVQQGHLVVHSAGDDLEYGELAICREESVLGSSDWISYSSDFGRNFYGRLTSVNGQLMMIGARLNQQTHKPDSSAIAFATTDLPQSQADWRVVDLPVATGNAFFGQIVRLNPGWGVIVEDDTLGYPFCLAYFTTDLDLPSGPGDWQKSILDCGLNHSELSLQPLQDRIAIAYTADNLSTGPGVPTSLVRVGWSNVERPVASTDWSISSLAPELVTLTAGRCTMTVHRDRMVMALTELSAMSLYYALDSFPSDSSRWTRNQFIAPAGSEGQNGGYGVHLEVVSGRLLLSWNELDYHDYNWPYGIRESYYFRSTARQVSFEEDGASTWDYLLFPPLAYSSQPSGAFQALPYGDGVVCWIGSHYSGTELFYSEMPW